MLFFVDESWQTTSDNRFKIGVLSAIPIASTQFNQFSFDTYNIKRKHLGFEGANLELKGNRIFARCYFRLEQKGIRSEQLNLARDIFSYCETKAIKTFASVTFAKDELDLACANENQLERPFFFLFERINQYMKEQYPDNVATLIFDDRGNKMNLRISKSISNFFHKCSSGRLFDKILKVPFFAISHGNIGIQIADLSGHIIGRRFTGDKQLTTEFFKRVRAMQFENKETCSPDKEGVSHKLRGIKVIRDRKLVELNINGEDL